MMRLRTHRNQDKNRGLRANRDSVNLLDRGVASFLSTAVRKDTEMKYAKAVIRFWWLLLLEAALAMIDDDKVFLYGTGAVVVGVIWGVTKGGRGHRVSLSILPTQALAGC
jgi:hypothetical protein